MATLGPSFFFVRNGRISGTLGKTRRKLASNPFTEALLGRAGLSGPRLRVNRHFKPFDLNRPPSKSLSRFLPKKMFKSR